LLDSYPKEKHGTAMAMWGVGVMIGPILGPSLGGWLTEYYSWRWVFYINLPLGLLTWFGLAAYIKETPIDQERKFDWLGFVFLSISLGALQMMLDRGESLDWFRSPEVVIEACLACLAFYLFLAHILTFSNPFIEPSLFKDRNFSLGLVIIFVVGIILLATMALLPPFMQGLMGYPIIDIGFLLAPRGVGTMLAMVIVGKYSNRLDGRYLIATGLLLTALSLYMMTGFTSEIAGSAIVLTGVIQGFGLGFIFPPLPTITFTTLEARYRNDGTALFSLMRNLGSSIGISIVMAYLIEKTQTNHSIFADQIHIFSQPLQQAIQNKLIDIQSPEGLALINALVTKEAATLAYLQDFRLMMYISLAALPLILLLRKPVLISSTKQHVSSGST
jgi:DHA2 family multidrug resistance protein